MKKGPQVSLCVIVKNEAHNLRDCIAPVANLVGDIVVIDTGSTDGTVEIARGLGARVFAFPWVDSFAAARNESLRHALGDWVLWLDADDRVDEPNRGRLGVLLDHLPNENVGFVMKCLCLPDPKTGRSTTVDHVRLFRRHPALRWRYRVHEQILPSLRALGGTVRWSDVVVHHTGYQDPALRQTKLERDFRLLGLEHAENPGDPFVLFNLGMILHEWGRCDEALPYLNESLRQSHPTDSIVRKLYALISQCHRLGGRLEEALETCREGQRHYPHDLELLFHESVVRKQLGDRPGAEGCLLRLQFASEGDHFASVNPALRSAIARHNLGVLYREEGRDAEAETYWQAVVADNPDYLPSWIGLAELYMSQGRWPEFAAALAWLEADGRAGADTAMLRARALSAGAGRGSAGAAGNR
jgi:tetratricopeptide (TPR) repeat protein